MVGQGRHDEMPLKGAGDISFSQFWRLEDPIQGLTGPSSGEGYLPGVQMAAFSLCVLRWGTRVSGFFPPLLPPLLCCTLPQCEGLLSLPQPATFSSSSKDTSHPVTLAETATSDPINL